MLDAGVGSSATRLRTLQIGMQWFTSGSGGLDRVFRDLMLGLPEYGVATSGAVVGPVDIAARTSGQVVSFAPDGAPMLRRLLGARATIGRLIEAGGIDLVASHFAMYTAPALDRMRRLPLVVHFHGPWAEESRAEGRSRAMVVAKRALEAQVYRRADRVIVLSDAFGRLLTTQYGVDPRRVRKVPGAVDVVRFNHGPSREDARRCLGWPTDRPILLSVRRLISRVGLDRLLEAMVPTVVAHPDVLLCIAGTGSLAEALQRQVQSTGLSAHVRFLGFVPDDDLPLAYRAADINVVPTVSLEGFGLTAAEALAAGTPSIVTPVGGLPEVVAELSQDLVFASTSAGDLADGLIDVLRGRRRLPNSAACSAYAAKHFSTELAAARTASVYRELA